ncbi:PIN domain-containing protein [Glycomyces buryatensis]|uniref:Ribonuclease VapC n=1 Tax=Glycomyces buryatensis TaxID=2570927 RepID=A0A4S8QNM3_9ACTN|nr:PIN domain-containing protein [Glycomyces buryatensis]THV42314.1 PIN domain-containing protein [Glycomyces buryatensis]
MIICDTNCLISLVNDQDPHHEAVREIAAAQSRPLVVSPLVLAEFDYLVRKLVSGQAVRAILSRLLQGRMIEVAAMNHTDLLTAFRLDGKYAALDLGLTDATVVVLAYRYRTVDLLTRDERDFRPITPLQGGAFRLLPSDR